MEVYSAGVSPREVDSDYHRLMKEIGIDTRGQDSKPMDDALMRTMDVVVTLCEPGKAACPMPPAGVKHVDWNIPGWESFAQDRIAGLRLMRDEIRRQTEQLVTELTR